MRVIPLGPSKAPSFWYRVQPAPAPGARAVQLLWKVSGGSVFSAPGQRSVGCAFPFHLSPRQQRVELRLLERGSSGCRESLLRPLCGGGIVWGDTGRGAPWEDRDRASWTLPGAQESRGKVCVLGVHGSNRK